MSISLCLQIYVNRCPSSCQFLSADLCRSLFHTVSWLFFSLSLLLVIMTTSAKRSVWKVNCTVCAWEGDLNEKDLNLELVYIYTGSKPDDVGMKIFKRLNDVAAKQGDSASACLHLSLMCSRLLQSKGLNIVIDMYDCLQRTISFVAKECGPPPDDACPSEPPPPLHCSVVMKSFIPPHTHSLLYVTPSYVF